MSNFIPKLIFKLCGWKITGTPPKDKKFVIIAAPHTSNWDFVYGLCAWNLYGLKPRYLIKKELFRFPLNLFFKATGGLPVDRSKSSNLTDAIVNMFNERESLVAIIPPEGTRKTVERWKTGFYYVALNAKVPLVMGSLDYAKKEATLSEPFWPTGNIEMDFKVFREFYKNTTPKHPGNFSIESIKPS